MLAWRGMRLLAGLAILMGAAVPASAQLRIVDYNTANSSVLPRAGMDTILAAIGTESINGIARNIDVLCLQEQANVATTTQAIVNIMNQVTGTTDYSRGVVNAGTTGAGRVGVVYNTQTVSLIAEDQFTFAGSARSTMRYLFRPVGYENGESDFYVYVDHYKAGTTSTDLSRRDQQATALRANADALGEGKNILYTGDFNIQSAGEAMYGKLLAAGPGQAFDPINVFATWHDNNALRYTHTQSPTTDSSGGLTTGGMDDRFDFQLVSGEVRDGEGFSYIGPGVGDVSVSQHSYHAFGNNGTHIMNGDINVSSNTAQPTNVLDALRTVSDHIPVVADYQLPAKMGVQVAAAPARVIQGASASLDVTVTNVAPVAVTIGADELDFSVSGSGALGGGGSGIAYAVSAGQVRSVTLDTATPGAASGAVLVESTSQDVANGHFSQLVQYEVLSPSEASFAGNSDQNLLHVDFGRHWQGSGPQSQAFSIHNLLSTPGFTASLDLDGTSGAGDVSRLFTDFAPGSVAAGASQSFLATLDTAAQGAFAASWTFTVSDEDLLGAASGADLLLQLTGSVLLYGDFDADGTLDADDIDLMFQAVGGDDLFFDLTGDGVVTSDDVDYLVRDIFGTEYGDANLDRMVSGADYTLWADGFGAVPGGWAQGDFSGDGVATGADYTLWADHFGFVAPSAAAVPEPAAWSLALSAIAAAALMRRGGRSRAG